MHYPRSIQPIVKKQFFKNKVLVIYGARRTGKTTLIKNIIANYKGKARYVNCELHENQWVLQSTNSTLLKDFIASNTLMVFDEAQHIPNIGLILKVLVDSFPDVQFIATGSSSFELSGQIAEPLTGRSRQFLLLPLSLEEVHSHRDWSHIIAGIHRTLSFGLYPEVYLSQGDDVQEELYHIASNYLYKDILHFENLKKPEVLLKLLQALARQTGSQSSINELARITGSNVHTISRYLNLLEHTFVIFRLSALSRNLRKEIAKSRKIYFYDVGIRNALMQNFGAPELRQDAGALWENFCISERLKFNQNHRRFVNSYFWRTYDQQEIDLIEEKDGYYTCFEFKWRTKRSVRMPKAFREAYPNSGFRVITPENVYQLYEA